MVRTATSRVTILTVRPGTNDLSAGLTKILYSSSSDKERRILDRRSWPNLRYHAGIYLEGLSKTTKHLRIVVPAEIQNGHIAEFKPEALPIEPTRPATRLTYEIQVYACN
jgi:hypothetical protein